ncbi:MAG: CoA-transferase subunit beta [Candidatus Hodarchaeales archaeon]|jgi:glutaconate CoA-transferase subunit B
MSTDYEVIDQITVSLAREIKDNESCYIGIAIPLAVVAIQLARMNHAPNLDFIYGGYWISPDLDVDLFSIMTDVELFVQSLPKARGFSKLLSMYNSWGGPKFTLDFGILRPGQIDQYGNINNSIIGDLNNPKVRLPGGAAVGDICNACHRVLAYVPRHDTRTFVEKVDFITARGASPSWRREMSLDAYQGITTIITDLAVLDFQTADGRMRLQSVHETSSLEEVIENTGFSLIIPNPVPNTLPPTEKELEIISTRADPMEIRKFDYRAR